MLIKIIIVGNTGVGKSCLLLRYCEAHFHDVTRPTVGVDFKLKTVQVGDHRVKLQLWDTAGQERFRTVTSAYYRGSRGVLVVYDVTDRSSFESVTMWMQNIRDHADDDVDVVLVGSKGDLAEAKVVSTAEARALARELDIEHIETSAKENLRVDEPFELLARKVLGRLHLSAAPASGPPAHALGLSEGKPRTQPGCC